MKIVIIGGVAAGTSAAAKIRRTDEDAAITIYEKDRHVSYGTCGLPYYVSGRIENINSLVLNNPKSFSQRFNIGVRKRCEVLGIDIMSKTIKVKDLKNGEVFSDNWDKLLIATGSKPIELEMEGTDSENVFTLKTIDDGLRLKRCLDKLGGDGLQAVIIGGGFIGLELLEAFKKKGLKVTILEKTRHLLPMFDWQIIGFLHDYLKREGIDIITEEIATGLIKNKDKAAYVQTGAGDRIKADIVFFGIGTRPESRLASDAGIAVDGNGAICVDKFLQTDVADIYSAGDCCQAKNEVSGESRPYYLASIANRQGRTAGYNMAGGRDVFCASTVTSIIKVLDLTLAKTGISLKEAERAGIDAGIIEAHLPSHVGYYPGAQTIHMMLLYNKENGSILGFQAIGKKGVSKRADIISTAIRAGMKAWDLAGLDLGYQPEFGSAKDAVNILGMIAENVKKREVSFIETEELESMIREKRDFMLLDVRTEKEYRSGSIEGSVNIHIDDLRKNLHKLEKDKAVIVYCKTGYRSYLAYRILANSGFKKLRVLNGSITSWSRKI